MPSRKPFVPPPKTPPDPPRVIVTIVDPDNGDTLSREFAGTTPREAMDVLAEGLADDEVVEDEEEDEGVDEE